MVSLLIPLMIAGGFDGVEPLRPSAPPRETLAASCGLIRVIESRRAYGVASTARRLGIHPSQLTYILHGQRKPNDALRRRLARLGITRTVDGKEFGEVE